MSTYLFYLSTEIILDFNPIISYINIMLDKLIIMNIKTTVLMIVLFYIVWKVATWSINTGFNAHYVIAYQSLTNGQRKLKEFALIVDSIWLYPILGIVGLAILYWFN